MESPSSSATPHEAQGSFLTPTSGSGLKHRIRELECIIESELRSLQKQVQQFKCQKIVQVSITATLIACDTGVPRVSAALSNIESMSMEHGAKSTVSVVCGFF